MNDKLTDEGIIIQLIEEMAELTQMLVKKLRMEMPGTFPVRCSEIEVDERIVEEVADVEMILLAYKLRLGEQFQSNILTEKHRKLSTRQYLHDELT